MSRPLGINASRARALALEMVGRATLLSTVSHERPGPDLAAAAIAAELLKLVAARRSRP